MKRDVFFDFMMKGVKGMKMPRGDKNSIMNFQIPIPPLAEQQKIVAKIESYEAEIQKAQAVINGSAAKKQAILNQWLG